MYNIIFISTIHTKIGECNPAELYKIIERIKPEVIFLEALESTYTEYENQPSYCKKLEISAIKKYEINNTFKYIPVLDYGFSDAFEKKYRIVGKDPTAQLLVASFQALAGEGGFNFLNSPESTRLQEEMRMEELNILNKVELANEVDRHIDEYENGMLRNIRSYCEKNQFTTAIFMCGVAHRKSIIEKIDKHTAEKVRMNWVLFNHEKLL